MSLITSAQRARLLLNARATVAAERRDESIDHYPVVHKNSTAVFEPPEADPKGEGPRWPE